MAAHSWNSSTWKAAAGASQVGSKPGLYSKTTKERRKREMGGREVRREGSN